MKDFIGWAGSAGWMGDNGGPTPPPSYPLGFSTLGISSDGFVYDGSVSQVWTDSARTTPAGDGDVVGAAEDLSGNANHLVQTSSPLKPVVTIAGGVSAIRLGPLPFLDPTADITVGAAFSVVAVVKQDTGVEQYFLSTFRGAWGSGGYFGMAMNIGGSNRFDFFANSGPTVRGFVANGGNPFIAQVVRSGTGADQTQSSTSTVAGSTIFSATTSENSTPANAIRVGVNNFSTGTSRVAFLLYCNEALTAGQLSTIRAYLATKFGAWA